MDFPNLARGQNPSELVIKEVTGECILELSEAGIEVPSFRFPVEGEVPSQVIGFHSKWQFKRAWYYWVATGYGIPVEDAEAFYKKWGTEARAEGDACCRSPLFWNKGFPTTMYHIDTQEALNAFVEMLNTIQDRGIKMLVEKIEKGEEELDESGILLKSYPDGTEDFIYKSKTLGIVREIRKHR